MFSFQSQCSSSLKSNKLYICKKKFLFLTKTKYKRFQRNFYCPLLWSGLTHLLLCGVRIWYFLLFEALFAEAVKLIHHFYFSFKSKCLDLVWLVSVISRRHGPAQHNLGSTIPFSSVIGPISSYTRWIYCVFNFFEKYNLNKPCLITHHLRRPLLIFSNGRLFVLANRLQKYFQCFTHYVWFFYQFSFLCCNLLFFCQSFV